MAYKIVTDITCGPGAANNGSATDWRHIQETFVSLIKWLDTLSSIGVTRVASYYGAAQTNFAGFGNMAGTGFDYWDRQLSAGTNAWAVYSWGSAQTPFYMLIQWAPGSIIGAAWGATGAPAAAQETSYGGIACSFAFRADGSSPWNGTTNNNGADTKGTPVWKPTSNAVQDLYVFPRCNSTRGTYFSSKQWLAMICTNAGSNSTSYAYRWKTHAIADENNIMFACDMNSIGIPQICYFGKFTPINDMFYQTTGSYWMLQTVRSPPPNDYGNSVVYGAITPNGFIDGGIQHPTPASGTIGYSFDTTAPSYWTSYTYQSNPSPAFGTYNLSGSLVGTCEEMPFLIFMNESSVSGTFGLVGTSSGPNDFLRLISGIPTYTTFNGKSRITWARHEWTRYTGFTTPWLSSATPFQSFTREGVYYG